jgi:putative membrane protein
MEANEPRRDSRTFTDYLGLVARGFAMGASNNVPGVSGGTMAMILGIYEEFVASVKGVLNREAIALALRFKIKRALDLIPWKFLVSVAAGMFLAVFTTSFFLEWVLHNYPALLWAFFFGLVAASVITVGRRVKRWSAVPIVGVIVGAVGAYLLVGAVPMETPNTWWFLILSGAIAICAMVLPGVSGAFILVLLGKYEYILSAVTNGDIVSLLMVIIGAVVGIVSIAQVLSWLFKRYHDGTVSVLMGMLIGSLRKVWPWKETIEYALDRHGEQVPIRQANVLPATWSAEVAIVIVLALCGFALIAGLSMWAAGKEKKDAAETAEGPAEA